MSEPIITRCRRPLWDIHHRHLLEGAIPKQEASVDSACNRGCGGWFIYFVESQQEAPSGKYQPQRSPHELIR